MKPGAACQLRQQSFPWYPETLMEPRLTSGGGDMRAGAPPLQLVATVRLQIRAASPLWRSVKVLSRSVKDFGNKVNRRFINLPSSGL